MNKLTDPNYLAIAESFKGKTAERTSLPYMNHIDEGLRVLDALDATLVTKQAFCLHPLVQLDTVLINEITSVGYINTATPQAILLAMEYRNCLNKISSKSVISKFSPRFVEKLQSRIKTFPGLYHMAVADKIQNNKDFTENYIDGSSKHANYKGLTRYFNFWLHNILRLSDEDVKMLTAMLR